MLKFRKKNRGFTLVELLTVLAIITMLLSLLVPSLNAIRRVAKETKQRAHLASIDVALTAFRNDYGDYPPSEGPIGGDYCGAQKLCEALLGRDLMGFHPSSNWNATDTTYYNSTPQSLEARRGRYLEFATTNAFKLGGPEGLFAGPTPLNPDTYVLCDVFGDKRITLANGQTVKAGAPILYCKANTSGSTIRDIYRESDDDAVIVAKQQADGTNHPLDDPAGANQFFYDYITDPKVPGGQWPYRPDSYLLITAGADGLYGTADDICNFGD